jgi:hypothetical protein
LPLVHALLDAGPEAVSPTEYEARPAQSRPLPGLTLDRRGKPDTVHPLDDLREINHVSAWGPPKRGGGDWMKD